MRRRRLVSPPLAFISALVFACSLSPRLGATAATAAVPQSQDATSPNFRGTVLDGTRAPIPGARVTATSDRGGQPLETLTNAQGSFTLALPPGQYSIRISATGFTAALQTVRT